MINQYELTNTREIPLNDSNRMIIRSALELYRNETTIKLYGDLCNIEYYDIELLEIDEILQLLKD